MKTLLCSVILTAAISLFAIGGCGSDDTTGGVDATIADAMSSAATSCETYCDNQGTATDCPEEVATQGVGQCKQLCGALVQSLDDECMLMANAFFTCSASLDSWKCLEGGNLPVQVDDSCKAESDAYADCVASQ